MRLKKSKSGESFPRLENGTYMSRIVSFIYLGIHLRDDRKPDDGSCGKVLIGVEYPTELIEIDGTDKPRLLSKKENMFFSEKANLPKIFAAAIPGFDIEKMGDDEDFDPATVLGKPVMTSIGSTITNKAKIVSFTGVVKGLTVPDQVTPSTLFDFDEPDLDVFNGLTSWVQDDIKKGDTYNGSKLQELLGEKATKEDGRPEGGYDSVGDDDTIPF